MPQNSQEHSTETIALEEEQALAVLSLPTSASYMSGRKRSMTWSTIPLLVIFGALLEGIYLALYPLFVDTAVRGDVLQRALPGLLPWLSDFYWTSAFPQILELLRQVPWLDPAREGLGRANLQLFFLLLASLLVFVMAYIGSRITRKRLARLHNSLLLCVVLLLTSVFAATLLLAPVGLNVLSQDVLTYGLYGRLLVFHHVNPYVVAPGTFTNDPFWMALAQASLVPRVANQGPIWIDLSLLVTLLARDSVVNVLLGFRVLALLAHVLNAALIWLIMSRLKPEARLSTTLLYAWNPLVLLGVFAPHLEIVVVSLLLLAALFYLRGSLLLSWVFALLAALVNVQCVLLLPLVLHVIMRKTRLMRLRQRMFWWSGLWIVSLLVIALADLPYWQNGGAAAQVMSLRQQFWPDQVANTLASALLNLPLRLPSQLVWLMDAHVWALAALVLAGLFVLLVLWLADKLELVMLYGSWIFLLLLICMPIYWPWFVIVPLVLALCSNSQSTKLLALLLTVGALLDYYFWQWKHVWTGQALVAVWLPLLLWGWLLFFMSTWRVTRARSTEVLDTGTTPAGGISRSSWFTRSRPSRPGRR